MNLFHTLCQLLKIYILQINIKELKMKNEQEQMVVYQQNTSAFDSNLKEKLSSKTVHLSYENWKTSKMSEACLQIKEWKIQVLWGGHNKTPKIYRQIAHIIFPNLKMLSLRENEIESIEGFHRMHLPSLSELFFRDKNCLNSISDLRKGQWKDLQQIQININKLYHAEKFYMMTSPKLKDICVERGQKDEGQFQDIRFFLKYEGKQFTKLWIGAQKRIGKESIKGSLKKKYPNINIQIHQ